MAHIKERTTRRGKVFDVCWGTRSFTTRTLEEALLTQIRVERGDEPARELPDALTLAAFLDAFDERWTLGKSLKTLEAGRNARRHLASLGGLRLSQLRAAHVEDEIAAVAAAAPRAAQQALAHLQKALRSAQERGHKIDPRILTLKPPSYESKEIRFLTWPEVVTLARELPTSVHRIVPFAALTGMRKGELFDLTDSRVDLDGGFVTLRVTKTRKPRQVWLSSQALQLLREQLVARTPNQKGLVFPTKTGHRLDSRFEASYREAVKAAGLDGATFHSLRHTCASLMIRAGCNPLEIAEQLGHMRGGKPDATMIWQRYGWLYAGSTQRAVQRLDALIREDAAQEEATG